MSLTEHPAHAQGYADARRDFTKMEPISETMRRWESERYLLRTDPQLAKLYRAEAIADRKAECQSSDAANMPAIRDLLREVIALRTGKPFKNPLFP